MTLHNVEQLEPYAAMKLKPMRRNLPGLRSLRCKVFGGLLGNGK